MPTTSPTSTTTYITDQSSIGLFNRGPVTGTFTLPASCLSTLTWKGSMYFGHQYTGYFDTACFPSPTSTPALNPWDLYYYSPAQCPSGWAEATQLTSSFVGWEGTISLSLGSSTTAVICCPSGYFYAGYDHACASAFTSTTSTLLYIDPVLSNNIWYSTNANTPSTTTVIASSIPYTIHGDGIPVWWQSSDLTLFATQTASLSSAPTSTHLSTSSTEPIATSTNPPTQTPSPNGLSSGAKIGIGIGIPLAAIAIGVLVFFVYYRRREREPFAQPNLPDTSAYTPSSQTMEALNRAAIQEIYSEHDSYNGHHSAGHHELPV